MKKGVSATKAFESFAKQLSFLDCNQTSQVAMSLAISQLLGKETFDSRALSMKQIRLSSQFDKYNIITEFVGVLPFTPPASLSDPLHDGLVKGQSYHMRNMEAYIDKHIHGDAPGFELAYIGDGKFIGLGLDPSGMTLSQIAVVLFEAYNADPIDEETLMPTGKGSEYIEIKISETGEIIRVFFNEIKAWIKGLKEMPKDINITMVQEHLFPYVIEKERQRKNRKITFEEFLKTADFFRKISSLTSFRIK
jgi:hypothetical protein